MPLCKTEYFGPTAYEEDSVVRFPAGLPGFERETGFLALAVPQHRPTVLLQSIATPNLCFVTLPVLVIDPGYQLELRGDDLERLGLRKDRQPEIGRDVICLAILTIRQSGTTANLLAPLVINLRNRLAVQAIAPASRYSHRHPLPREVTL